MTAHPRSVHAYTSTACQHDRHDRCRQTCKFCDAPCQCDCHKEPAMTDHATALAACLPDDPSDHDPIGVPSDAVRGVLATVAAARHLIEGWDEFSVLNQADYEGLSALVNVVDERIEALRTALGDPE